MPRRTGRRSARRHAIDVIDDVSGSPEDREAFKNRKEIERDATNQVFALV